MRNYKRKTTRGSTPDVLARAAEEVATGKSLRGVADDFHVDRMTLKRFIQKRNQSADAIVGYKAVAQKQSIFPPNMEEDLASHVKLLADMFHGLSLQKCCILAYEFASRNGLRMPDSWNTNGKAGKDWWLGFRSRHHLAIRNPEATSFARASAFNRPVVTKFYDNLATVIDRNHFKPEDIYNCDETGCTTVQKPKAVVTEQGRKQVGSITSAERGELVTVVYTTSASGNVLPPMFIFPRVNYKDYFIRGAPAGSIGSATRSGWMNADLFLDYLQHVIRHTRCTQDHKILLILDNHESHISLRAIDLAKAHGIILLTIPPHTSHRLQPLDRSVYAPFKGAYNRALDGWLRSNPGKTVTIYDIPALVNEAQMSAFIPRNVISGFQSTGIYPFNRDLFSDLDFAPAAPTDRELEISKEVDEQVPNLDLNEDGNGGTDDEIHPSRSQSRPSSDNVSGPGENSELLPGTSTGYMSPVAILPVPKTGPRKRTSQKRKRGSTKILTDTPIRDEIARTLEKAQKKTTETKARKALFQKRRKQGRKEPDPDDLSSSSSSSEPEGEFEEESDEETSDEEMEIIEGDFVVVSLAGKARVRNFIARVDVVDGDDYEGIFLRKVSARVDCEDTIFVANTDDTASFAREDIVHKLPQPRIVGGSARRCCQLLFKCSLSKWHLAY